MSEPPSPPPLQPTASYIYPVRSLLTGIQPADSDVPIPQPPEPNVLVASLRRDEQLRAERQPGLSARRGVAPSLPIQRSGFVRDEFYSAPLPAKPESASPTFFSAQSQFGSPQSRPEDAVPPTRRIISGTETRDMATPPPTDPPRPYPADGRDGIVRLTHLTSPPSAPLNISGEDEPQGIFIHDSVDGSVIRNSVHGSRASAQGTGTEAGTGTGTGTGSESRAGSNVSGRPPLQPPSTQVSIYPGPESQSVSASDDSQEPLITVRFQHVQDEHGNHVVVGREGRLARCEDEPIRVPGAVQGFGVLIALEEDYETGNLVVRQVSEVRLQQLYLRR